MLQHTAGVDTLLVRHLLAIVDAAALDSEGGGAKHLVEACRLLEGDLLYTVMSSGGSWLKRGVGPRGELGTQILPRLSGIVRGVLSKRSRFLATQTPVKGTGGRGVDGWPGFTTGSTIAVPIHHRGTSRGVLVLLRSPDRAPFTVTDLERAEFLAEALAVRAANEEQILGLEKLARTDGLTRLANYRSLREAMARELKQAARLGEPLSIVMVDVDNLKSVNSRFGHLAGSEILRRLARVLERHVRGSDFVAKYGGDEFVIILPSTPRDGAVRVAQRVREAVIREVPGIEPDDRISCSCGVAVFPEDGADYVRLITAADRALSSAKDVGRNAVATSAGPVANIAA